MKTNKKSRGLTFTESADEHMRIKFKKPASELPDKDSTEYSTPVEFLEGLSKLVYHFKSKGKLSISQELLSGKRKEPYKEPEIKDYGTAEVVQMDKDVEIRSSVKYTLDENQKLRLRREHQRIADLEKSDDEDRRESMAWMFGVTEERHLNRIADENPEIITRIEHYKLPKLIVEAMVTNLRITKEQKITMVERLRTKYRCSIFNSPGDARAKIEGYLHIQTLAKCLGLEEVSYMLMEADTLESVDGMLEEVQKEILDGRDKVKRLQDKNIPHQAELALLPSSYMELIKFFEDYNYSVKVPELAVGSWCNMVEEPERKKDGQRNKCSYCGSNSHYIRVSKDRKSDLACPKAIEQREKAKSDPKCPKNLKNKLRKFKIQF